MSESLSGAQFPGFNMVPVADVTPIVLGPGVGIYGGPRGAYGTYVPCDDSSVAWGGPGRGVQGESTN